MLCRALMAALVVSCMCPRDTIAHTQATQRKDHRKDLACVLWLSGLQKEDLDVNMLTKLQRHDVNIDNMNNDDLREDCLNPKSERDHTTIEKLNETDEDFATTDAVEEAMSQESINKNKSKTIKFINILKAIMDSKSSDDLLPDLFKSKSNDEQYYKFLIALQEEKAHILATVPTTINTEKRQQNNTDVITNVIPSNLESFLYFWNTLKTADKQKHTQIVPNIDLISDLKPIKDNAYYKTAEQYSKEIIGNRMNSQNYSTMPTREESSGNDDDHLSHLAKMYALFQNNYNHNENETKILNKIVSKQVLNDNSYFDNNMPQQTIMMRARSDKYAEINSKKHFLKDISDVILVNDQVMNMNQLMYPNIVIGGIPYNINYEALRETSTASYLETHIRKNFTLQSTPSHGASELKLLPKLFIDQIAENVKASVLKELHDKMKSTSTVPTLNVLDFTSKTVPPVTVPTKVLNSTKEVNKTSETNQVLKTLLDILKEFKTIKEKPVTRESGEHLKFVKNQIVSNPSVNLYSISKAQEVAANNHYQEANKEYEQFRQMPNIGIAPTIVKLREASIIQTNLREIPPLGIPLSNPNLLVHQNLVVSSTNSNPVHPKPHETWITHHKNTDSKLETKHRYHSTENKLKYEHKTMSFKHIETTNPFKHIEKANSFKHIGKTNLFKHIDKTHPIKHIENSNSFKHIELPAKRYSLENSYEKFDKHGKYSFSGTTRSRAYGQTTHRPRYSFKPRGNVEHMQSFGQDTPNRYKDNISVGILQRHNKERFHERLERVAEDEKDSKCCGNNSGLATRQQVSMNNMKPRYDDTHFKNFLKTQQKVNDMLERILATKTMHSGVQSVETT